MRWIVKFCDEFESEFSALNQLVQDELLAHAQVVREFGPALGRPRVDTVKGSRYANMKELRFDAANGVWRVAFIFDPAREAILLVAGDKLGANQRKFYETLIRRADNRYANYLTRLNNERR